MLWVPKKNRNNQKRRKSGDKHVSVLREMLVLTLKKCKKCPAMLANSDDNLCDYCAASSERIFWIKYLKACYEKHEKPNIDHKDAKEIADLLEKQ